MALTHSLSSSQGWPLSCSGLRGPLRDMNPFVRFRSGLHGPYRTKGHQTVLYIQAQGFRGWNVLLLWT